MKELAPTNNLYREGGLASVHPFAHNSIFQGVEEGEQKQLMEYAQAELMNRRAKPPEELAYLNNIMETKGRPTVQKPLPDAQQFGMLLPDVQNPSGVGPMSLGPNWDKIDRPRHPSFFDRNIPDHKHEDDKIVPTRNPSDLYEIGPKNTLLPAIAPSLQQLSGFTTSDDPKIRPPGIQLNRKYGGSLTQKVQDLLRNLS